MKTNDNPPARDWRLLAPWSNFRPLRTLRKPWTRTAPLSAEPIRNRTEADRDLAVVRHANAFAS